MAIKRNDYAIRYKDPKSKNRVIGTSMNPKIEAKNDDIYITSRTQDRLDLLANKYYGTPRLWWIIAQANNLGEGHLIIKPGTRLRIPQDVQGVLRDLEKINIER
tara:strand:- start:3676 stop:3987 length:312 start_codon:yes stop_codon:yes gene_type:complete